MGEENLNDRHGFSFDELFIRTDASWLKARLKLINSEISNNKN